MGPGIPNRYCWLFIVSVTERFSLTHPAIGITCCCISKSISISRNWFPVGPPAIYMPKEFPPNSLMTLETLIPPPPGSYTGTSQRNLLFGCIPATVVLLSIAGLTVSVMIFFIFSSFKHVFSIKCNGSRKGLI